MGHSLKNLGTKAVDRRPEPSLELSRGGLGGLLGLRPDQIHHRLGTSKVELSVEESPLGKLPRPSHACTGGKDGGQHP